MVFKKKHWPNCIDPNLSGTTEITPEPRPEWCTHTGPCYESWEDSSATWRERFCEHYDDSRAHLKKTKCIKEKGV